MKPMQWAVAFFGVAILLYIMKISGNFDVTIDDSGEQSQVERIARAIARAEGFFTDSTLLQSLNNPVGLKPVGGGSLRSFPTVEQGWQAAYNQIELMLSNRSNVYNREMSISQIAPLWTGGDKPEAWATIVSKELGVDKNTSLFRV